MERIKPDSGVEQGGAFGVLEYHMENGHYAVSVRWKDGVETVKRFPVVGITIVDPVTQNKIGRIEGKKALEILQKNAGEYNHGEFSWRDFL
jgi:hypothetical protein